MTTPAAGGTQPDPQSRPENGWGWNRRWTIGVARGVCMGCADIVPGVSGGTIAVALGIYERLLGAIQAVVSAATALLRCNWPLLRRRLAALDWLFLVPLLCGISATIMLTASVIETLLRDHPSVLAGLFCGLVAASAIAACRLFEWRAVRQLALMTTVAAGTFVLLGVQSEPVSEPPLLLLFVAGALAVCAMVMPGISGAFVMVMIGMYASMIAVITETQYLKAAVFVAGTVLGLAMFANVLSWLLRHVRNTVMAVLVGLMAGSLRVLWPWPNGVGVISRHADEAISGTELAWPAADEWLIPAAAAVLGFAAVLLISNLARRLR